MRKNKKPLPPSIKRYLNKVMHEADAKRKYRWAIEIYNRYHRSYIFDYSFEYKLGVLYDHLAIFKTSKMQNEKKKQRLSFEYFKRAREIYKSILKKNPDYFLAFNGLRRVYESLGDYKRAIRFGVRAYNAMKKIPKNQRGPLGIGNTYLLKGDYKNAEKWFKRELKDLGKNDLGANYNLLVFYNSVEKYKKAFPYAIKTEKILGRELNKGSENFPNADRNETLKLIRKRIETAKLLGK